MFHSSIEAKRPDHVAGVLAFLGRGRAAPLGGSAWAAFDASGGEPVLAVHPRNRRIPYAAHRKAAVILTVPRTSAEILAVACRENWPAELRDENGPVVALLVEGRHPVHLRVTPRP
ncbi:hypothetical protein [Sphingomonas sp. ID0503]|uniref:hypothetical protein n=1 Tax=Sphingomonas sp. ID0503 TaxID=3399691 RepID=UPI003AFB4487